MLSMMDHIKLKFRHLIMPQAELIEIADKHTHILDIGCGLGPFLTALSGKGKQLQGVEIVPDVVDKAKILLKENNIPDVNINYYNGDPDTISGWDNYDAVFLNDVLHHVPPKIQQDFLTKIHAHMKPGAAFVLKEIDAASPFVVFNKLHDLVVSQQYPYERSLACIKDWCEELGFKVEAVHKMHKVVYPHFILVMRKPS